MRGVATTTSASHVYAALEWIWTRNLTSVSVVAARLPSIRTPASRERCKVSFSALDGTFARVGNAGASRGARSKVYLLALPLVRRPQCAEVRCFCCSARFFQPCLFFGDDDLMRIRCACFHVEIDKHIERIQVCCVKCPQARR